MQGRRMGAIAGSAVGRGLSGGSKGPATWICIAVSRVVDHGSRGSEGRSSNLEKAGAADLPSIPFPSTMLGIVPARICKPPKAIPRQPREQTVSFLSPRLGVERIDWLPAFAWWHGSQHDEGQERGHQERNEHPRESGTAFRGGDKGHKGHAGQQVDGSQGEKQNDFLEAEPHHDLIRPTLYSRATRPEKVN